MVIDEISGIVGKKFVITNSSSMQSYTKGYRFGEGSALLVCRPGSLLEVWKVLEICVKNDLIVIMQAANTGLTGGSTPSGNDYDRDIVIISTMRIDAIHVINDGKQIIGFAIVSFL